MIYHPIKLPSFSPALDEFSTSDLSHAAHTLNINVDATQDM